MLLPFYVFNVTSVTGTVPPQLWLRAPLIRRGAGFANSCAKPHPLRLLVGQLQEELQNVLCLKRVGGLDEIERSDSRQDRTRMVNDVMTETHNAALLNGDLQTSI